MGLGVSSEQFQGNVVLYMRGRMDLGTAACLNGKDALSLKGIALCIWCAAIWARLCAAMGYSFKHLQAP